MADDTTNLNNPVEETKKGDDILKDLQEDLDTVSLESQAADATVLATSTPIKPVEPELSTNKDSVKDDLDQQTLEKTITKISKEDVDITPNKNKNFKEANFKKLNIEKIKFTLVPVLVIAIALLLTIFLTYPNFQQYNQVKLEVTEKQAKVVELENKLVVLNEFVQVQNVLKENSEFLTKAIPEPDKETVPQFMTLVQGIAKQSSVDLTSLNYSGSSPEKASSELTSGFSNINLVYIQGTAKSDYNSIKSFLKNLESSLRIMTIENIRLSGGGESESGNSLVTVNFALTAYAADINAEVIPEQALNYNLTDGNFTKVLDFLKTQKTYNTDVSDTGIGKIDPFAQ